MKKQGSVTKIKNGVYQIRVRRRNDEGKLKSISQTVHGSRDDAKDALKLLLKKIEKAISAPKKVYKTFDALFDAYLEVIKPTVAEQTYFLYERLVRVYLRPEFGSLLVTDLEPLEIDRFYALFGQRL